MSFINDNNPAAVNHRGWNLLLVNGEAGDPHFACVQLLTPFTDTTGTVTGFYDLKGNAWVVTQSGNPEEYIATDATRTLFGKNTLRLNFAGTQYLETVYVDNIGKINFVAATGFCLEYWIWQSSIVYNATAVPVHVAYVAASGGVPDVSRDVSVSTYGDTGKVRTITGGAYNGPYPFAFNQWNYVCIDYDPIAKKTCFYINGVLVDTYNGYQMGNADIAECYLLVGGGLGVGTSLYNFDVSIGQLRLSDCPRYAQAATIPVPTAPWPLHG